MERPGGGYSSPDIRNVALGDPSTSGIQPDPAASSAELSREERAEQEKWDAWAACAGLSRSAAKCRYIDTLIATMRTYAYGTPEARELVDELEFVWEQVRSNSSFHESGNGNGSGEIVEMEGDSPGGRERITKEGLRVLRPMSDQDEEDEEGQDEGDGIEQRNRRPREGTWQARVDKALVQMTAEIAALREVMEARGMRIWGGRRTHGWFGWVVGKVWALVKRAVVDALVVLVLYVVVRWRRGGRELVFGTYFVVKSELRDKMKRGVGRDLLKGG